MVNNSGMQIQMIIAVAALANICQPQTMKIIFPLKLPVV